MTATDTGMLREITDAERDAKVRYERALTDAKSIIAEGQVALDAVSDRLKEEVYPEMEEIRKKGEKAIAEKRKKCDEALSSDEQRVKERIRARVPEVAKKVAAHVRNRIV